jgi:transposase/IS5 family transposase
MGFIQGEGRNQGTLFPVVLDDLVPADHVCRVIDAFVDGLQMSELGFERAEAAETGRPGYDPRDLLKLYVYGYLHTIRSSRRLEDECRRNVELMWLLGRLYPDHKSIAEFRRMHRDAVTAAGAELVRFARGCGLIRGEWIAIDGTKFHAVASADSVRERQALQRYLDSMEKADEEQQASIDPSAVQAALEKLKHHPEPEARFMPVAKTNAPAYNVQTAVDAEHALIVAHAIVLDSGDNRCLERMAQAAKKALDAENFHVVADAGYSNGEQAARCEEAGILPHVPATRNVNNQGDGSFFGREDFRYQPDTDTYLCPEQKTLRRKQVSQKDKAVYYKADKTDCSACPQKARCTKAPQRLVMRLLHEDALNRMHQRATPEAMKLRRSTVEHPFATLKYRIFGHPRLLLRGVRGAQIEISLATMAYNLKRMVNILSAHRLAKTLDPA